MKIVHNSLREAQSLGDTPAEWLAKGMELEKAGEVEGAIKAYEKLIRHDALHQQAYERLMIIYRKEKEYKKELAVIKTGIAAFDKFYKKALKTSRDRKVIQISRALLKSTGLADKKGNPSYQLEPIGKWSRRKTLVEKRMKK